MKHLILSIFLFGVYSGTAQASLDDYKYIIVPKKFDGFKKENQHGTSTLVKHLFTQQGFNVVYDDGLPAELNNNRCLALKVGLNERSSLFSTKTVLVLRDCNAVEVMTSIEGKSKEKDYIKAYHEAIRRAFKSFEGLNYSYVPKERASEPVTISFKNDVKKLDDVKGTTSQNKKKDPMVEQEATLEKQSYKSLKPVASDFKKADENGDKDELEVQVATKEEQSYENSVPVTSTVKKAERKHSKTVLYAQEISNGFQLVDSTPSIKMKLFRTSLPNYFLVEGRHNGVLHSKDGKWLFEYYVDEKLIMEELEIKF